MFLPFSYCGEFCAKAMPDFMSVRMTVMPSAQGAAHLLGGVVIELS